MDDRLRQTFWQRAQSVFPNRWVKFLVEQCTALQNILAACPLYKRRYDHVRNDSAHLPRNFGGYARIGDQRVDYVKRRNQTGQREIEFRRISQNEGLPRALDHLTRASKSFPSIPLLAMATT